MMAWTGNETGERLDTPAVANCQTSECFDLTLRVYWVSTRMIMSIRTGRGDTPEL